MSARLDAVRKLLALHDLDAILVWNLTNVRYLSGFTGSEGALVITADKALFLSDSRYATQAAEQLKGFTPVIESQKMPSAVKQLKAARAKRIGFEDGTMTVEDHARLLGKLENAQLIGLGSKLDAIRLCKDTGEIAVMRKAAQIAEAGLDAALRVLKPGISENDVAVELELTMRREGASATSFETIIASGPRGALPHGIASDKKIAEGELVVIDWGCVYQGYCSDQTVTVAVGEVG
ncbi:aminopeptidase P family protein, partial [bacterium]|nr:aminopeptidase P family protein [bacterium]